MTEQEWQGKHAPLKMLAHVQNDASKRKLRLFACACCRAVWDRLPSDECRAGIEVAEQYADGLVSEEVRSATQRVVDGRPKEYDRSELLLAVAASWALVKPQPWELKFAAEVCSSNTRTATRQTRLLRAHANILRCLFGNPFRPVTFDPAWRTSDVMLLARQMYDSRDFGAMPILADALQDAGCENEDILSHCRDASLTHVRGCWVVDLVLGKE